MTATAPDAHEGGRLPPQSLEAERSVLGAMLLEREAIARAIEVLEESSFYRDAHRKIFRAILQLFERNEAADLITLSEELKRTGQLESVGGIPYLTTLFEYVATSANIDYHSKIVLEKSILRKLIEVSAQIAGQAYSARGDASELIDLAEQEIFAIQDPRLRRGFVPLKNLVADSVELIQELQDSKRHVTGIPSGFRDLDELTAGFQKSDLIIVAGRPSMGKTSFVLNIADFVATKRKDNPDPKPVAIFSLEMSKEQLVQRLLCSKAKIPGHKVRRGYMSQGEWPSLVAAADMLYQAPIYIDDTPSLGVLEMRAKARRLKAEVPLGLIIVDYVQLIHGAPGVENRQQEISQISRGLKALAKELQVPVIALSQLSRAVETRGGDKRPVLSDLRESGALEQDADVVIFIFREAMYERTSENENIAEILVRKQRNGPTGEIKLQFSSELTLFQDLTRYHIGEEAMRAPEPFEETF
jgi:replicative DNA helicase